MLWSGLRCEDVTTLKQSSITNTAKAINDIAKSHNVPRSKIVVDEDGVGGGLVDILKCKGFVNNSKPLKEKGKDTNFSNLKSQCYFRLAEYVNSSKIFVSCDEQTKQTLIEELEVIRRKDADKDGKLSVEGKDRVKELIGRSPDLSDDLMLRMYFEISKTTTRW